MAAAREEVDEAAVETGKHRRGDGFLGENVGEKSKKRWARDTTGKHQEKEAVF